MPVTPFGTKYAIGAGNNNHSRIPNRDRRATFRTITPDGRRVKITMNVRGTFQEPCVIFSDETGEWRAKAVIDKNNLPEWVVNYTVVEAAEIKRA